MTPYSDFLKAHASHDRDQFLAEVVDPHLLLPTITPEGELAPFLTVSAREAAPAARWLQGVSVLPVAKRSGVVFSHMITLGRAENMDLVVPHSAVSKFHLYFRRLDRWMISDADSLNGTKVDGHVVRPDRSLPLHSGATITLGDVVEMEFLEPEDLHARVMEESRALGHLG